MRKEVKAVVIVSVLLASAIIVLFAGVNIMYQQRIYPNYIASQPKFRFQNSYYSLEVTSYITKLKVNGKDITAYYNIFNCEENYEGNWELEIVQKQAVTTENNGKTTVLVTESTLLTQKITKKWTFYSDKPYFLLEITKIYLFDSTNLNNQIIVDVKNQGFHLSIHNKTLTFNIQNSLLTIEILECNKPVGWQPPTASTDYTEAQINIDGQSDRDSRFHYTGETEIAKLKVTFN